ncbi:hypothetical protein QUF63_00370 [Anaerolineales bacterium HSG25]|nr:hypothetical protein [Anaerolineales bacterium HSG25]
MEPLNSWEQWIGYVSLRLFSFGFLLTIIGAVMMLLSAFAAPTETVSPPQTEAVSACENGIDCVNRSAHVSDRQGELFVRQVEAPDQTIREHHALKAKAVKLAESRPSILALRHHMEEASSPSMWEGVRGRAERHDWPTLLLSASARITDSSLRALLPQSTCPICLIRQRKEMVRHPLQTNILTRWSFQRLNLIQDLLAEPALVEPAATEETPEFTQVETPIDEYGCPTSSPHQFELIPVESSAMDHPDRYHADLNLALRGYVRVEAPLEQVHYNGATAPDPPQLSGLFEPNRHPAIVATYQINHWDWGCSSNEHGCPSGPIQDWGATLIGVATTSGEAIYIPKRWADIYQGRFKALVLYASERQVTLGYTRQDGVTLGYVAHIQNICVDPNLLTAYRTQNNEHGWRNGGLLPALTNNQPLGTALHGELQVAIRDNGSFLDPRSSKDWWQH